MHKITTKDTYCFFCLNEEGEAFPPTQKYFGPTKTEAMAYFQAYKKAIQEAHPSYTAAWTTNDFDGDLTRANRKIEELEEDLKHERGEDDED